MIYDFVPFHEVAEEIANNLEKHYNDVDLKDGYGRPDLDWDNYMQQSLAGNCGAVIAKDDEKLVAYSVFLVGVNINHKTRIEAMNAGIFINKDYRGKITSKFLRKSDDFLRNLGVDEVMYILKDDRIGALLKRAKYKPKHIVWSK